MNGGAIFWIFALILALIVAVLLLPLNAICPPLGFLDDIAVLAIIAKLAHYGIIVKIGVLGVILGTITHFIFKHPFGIFLIFGGILTLTYVILKTTIGG